ncbi:hypothetical protein ACQJBY_064657 [Aegilops geniculata]
MAARLLLLSFDCPAVAGGRRSRLSAVPRMSSGAPLVRPPASSVRAFAVTAARGKLPHRTSVAVEGGGVYTVGDFMTKREQLHVVKPSTSVDEALERLVEHRITGFPVTDDHWNLVGVVSDYDLLALDLISGNGQTEADIFPEVDSTWKPSILKSEEITLGHRGLYVDDTGYMIRGGHGQRYSARVLGQERVQAGEVKNQSNLSRREAVCMLLQTFHQIQKLLSKTNGKVVSDVMTSAPLVVRETTNLEDAARLLLVSKYRRLPVVDSSGKLVGIITRGNVVRAALEFKKNVEGSL